MTAQALLAEEAAAELESNASALFKTGTSRYQLTGYDGRPLAEQSAALAAGRRSQ